MDLLGRWVEFNEIAGNLAEVNAQRWLKEPTECKNVLAVDSTIKDLVLVSTTGEEIRIGSLSDRAVLLNFWGEWCAPCIEEVPTLVDALSKYGKKGLTIIGMLKTENVEKALNFARSNKMNWPQVLLTDSLARRFYVALYPTNMLILPRGELVVRTLTVTPDFFDTQIGGDPK